MLTPSQKEYVYLIGSRKFGWYKIGKARRPSIRVSQLGILLPFRITIVAVWSTSRGLITERMMHEKYSKYAINGEWFGIPPIDLVKITREQQPYDSEIVFSLFDPSTYGKASSLGVGTNFSNIEKDIPVPKGIFGEIRRKVMREHAEKWLVDRGIDPSPENWNLFDREIRSDFSENHKAQMDDFFALAGEIVV